MYVDGKETQTEAFKDTFLSVHLEEGYHTIELKYMTPGLVTGAAVSGACIGLFVLTSVLRRVFAKRKQVKEL